MAAIVWDNIPRGELISCPHIEKACTTALYSDRRLGVSETVATAAATIQFFTGNNISPRGDLASRALQARLEMDRADPENRLFMRPDPIAWTEANRGRILAACYTILLGNPALQPGSNVASETRFKTWWRLVGSAVENAAAQHVEHVAALAMPAGTTTPKLVRFRDLFLEQEQDDEETASLADVLDALAGKWPDCRIFHSNDVGRVINDQSDYRTEAEKQAAQTIREFLFPNLPPGHTVTAKAIGKRLKRYVGDPVRYGARTLVLKSQPDPNGGPKGAMRYYVQTA